MHEGKDFLRAQVSNCVMQHKTLLESLEDHEKQAEDAQFRALCTRYLPRMREHQTALESYRATLGEPAGQGSRRRWDSCLAKPRTPPTPCARTTFCGWWRTS